MTDLQTHASRCAIIAALTQRQQVIHKSRYWTLSTDGRTYSIMPDIRRMSVRQLEVFVGAFSDVTGQIKKVRPPSLYTVIDTVVDNIIRDWTALELLLMTLDHVNTDIELDQHLTYVEQYLADPNLTTPTAGGLLSFIKEKTGE